MKSVLVALTLLLFAGISQADTTYDYVGAPFTAFNAGSSPCAPSCNVSGQVVVAQPFAPGTITTFDLTVNPPINFSFSAFNLTISPTSPLALPGAIPAFIQIGTDAAGLIDEWNVQIITTASVYKGVQTTVTSNLQFSDVPQFQGDTFNFGGSGLAGLGAAFEPGTWTQEGAVATPEPSSVLLLASGFGLLVLLSKKTLTA